MPDITEMNSRVTTLDELALLMSNIRQRYVLAREAVAYAAQTSVLADQFVRGVRIWFGCLIQDGVCMIKGMACQKIVGRR